MNFELKALSYETSSLEPYMSRETLEYHHGKHHKAYVDKLNSLIAGTEYQNMSLEEIICRSQSGPIFNNAAQIWNHELFWDTLKINASETPTEKLLEMMISTFGSFDSFKEKFKTESLSRFGSGWVWLIQLGNHLEIYSTPNAENPLVRDDNAITLLGCDVWEHSYYIDTRNDRAKYIENFWNIVDWKKVSERVK